MPELPEVETIARRLEEVVREKHISRVEILREKSFQGNSDQIIGSQILRITRKAKVLQVHLSDSLSLLIHLKMTGQLIYVNEGKRVGGGHPSDDWVNALPSKHTRVVIEFSEGGTLFFNDMRVFGWIKVADEAGVVKEMQGYAPDIIDPAITAAYFKEIFSRRSQPIKLVIMDNSVVAGIGNIYANDALHLAKVSPLRPAKSLSEEEIHNLLEAALFVINKGIELGGATIENYKNVDGMAGGYQNIVRVYQREGEKCMECGTTIIRTKQGGRSTFYCTTCQL
jgi:formamidopyrimidine-DNA glycosylase